MRYALFKFRRNLTKNRQIKLDLFFISKLIIIFSTTVKVIPIKFLLIYSNSLLIIKILPQTISPIQPLLKLVHLKHDYLLKTVHIKPKESHCRLNEAGQNCKHGNGSTFCHTDFYDRYEVKTKIRPEFDPGIVFLQFKNKKNTQGSLGKTQFTCLLNFEPFVFFKENSQYLFELLIIEIEISTD